MPHRVNPVTDGGELMQRNALTRARWGCGKLEATASMERARADHGGAFDHSGLARARVACGSSEASGRSPECRHSAEPLASGDGNPLFSLGRGFNNPTRPPTSAEC